MCEIHGNKAENKYSPIRKDSKHSRKDSKPHARFFSLVVYRIVTTSGRQPSLSHAGQEYNSFALLIWLSAAAFWEQLNFKGSRETSRATSSTSDGGEPDPGEAAVERCDE